MHVIKLIYYVFEKSRFVEKYFSIKSLLGALLGLITLGAATCHDAVKHGGEMVQQLGWEPIVVGTVVAWLSAIVSVRWMVGYLNRHGLAFFGWYRLAAALVMLILICQGLSFDSEDEDPAPDTPAVARAEN